LAGTGAAKGAPPANILRYSRTRCDPDPQLVDASPGLFNKGVHALVSAREGAVGDFATIVRWSYSGYPSLISTLKCASALLFLAIELGKARACPSKPVFTEGNLL